MNFLKDNLPTLQRGYTFRSSKTTELLGNNSTACQSSTEESKSKTFQLEENWQKRQKKVSKSKSEFKAAMKLAQTACSDIMEESSEKMMSPTVFNKSVASQTSDQNCPNCEMVQKIPAIVNHPLQDDDCDSGTGSVENINAAVDVVVQLHVKVNEVIDEV